MSTKIEWAKETWNPITGCTKVGTECDNCYAEKMANRLKGRFGYPTRLPFRPGIVHKDAMKKPYTWKTPRMIFVSSMGDLFHKNVDILDQLPVFRVMADCPQHTFLLLTKRPLRMLRFWMDAKDNNWPLPKNIWIGVTVALNLPVAMERLDALSDSIFKGWTRFVSIEPMLSRIDLEDHRYWLDWVICGAETGQKARPCKPEWVQHLRDDCVRYGIPFFFKKFSDGDRYIDGRMWEQKPENGIN